MDRVVLLANEFRPDVRDDLALRLGIPVAIEGSDYAAAIGSTPGGALELRLATGGSVVVELAGRAGSRRTDSPLCRAIGVGRGVSTVLDATAGFGRDAAELLHAGCHVTLCERERWLVGMVSHAIEAAGITDRAEILHADALDALAQHRADAVYLDPMYLPTGKSALPKAEAQALRLLCDAAPTDEANLLRAARRAAQRRVVVKRAPSAPPLANEKPPNQVKGKTVRFDIYPPAARGPSHN